MYVPHAESKITSIVGLALVAILHKFVSVSIKDIHGTQEIFVDGNAFIACHGAHEYCAHPGELKTAHRY